MHLVQHAYSGAGYYAYWERRVFAAINAMVLGAIDSVHSRLLKACSTPLPDSDAVAKPPVLMVRLPYCTVVLQSSPGLPRRTCVGTFLVCSIFSSLSYMHMEKRPI